jgi:maleylpyruvate isomerase
MPGLDEDPSAAIELCQAAHERLLTTVATISNEQVILPSRLPGWTIGHVVSEQRDADISQGAARQPAELLADLRDSQERLERAWDNLAAAGWPHPEFRGNDLWPATASPVRRLREVEMHHVDLGLGYMASDWPSEYVAWELPMLLATVPERVKRPEDSIDLVVWLAGRGRVPGNIVLDPW